MSIAIVIGLFMLGCCIQNGLEKIAESIKYFKR